MFVWKAPDTPVVQKMEEQLGQMTAGPTSPFVSAPQLWAIPEEPMAVTQVSCSVLVSTGLGHTLRLRRIRERPVQVMQVQTFQVLSLSFLTSLVQEATTSRKEKPLYFKPSLNLDIDFSRT